MRDQLRRAANSIALNMADGAGECLPAERARFYRIAKRSATECAGQVLVCRRLGLMDAPRTDAALDVLQRVIAMLVSKRWVSGGSRFAECRKQAGNGRWSARV